jgi:hypothetical protein
MKGEDIKKKNVLEILDIADTQLSAVGEMKGVMSIIVKCTLMIEEKLDGATKEIRKFNDSTTMLNKRLFALNRVLVGATIVGAFATLWSTGIIQAIFKLFRT